MFYQLKFLTIATLVFSLKFSVNAAESRTKGMFQKDLGSIHMNW